MTTQLREGATSAIEHLTLPNDQDASGRSLGDDELLLLADTIRSGTLTSTRGVMTRQLQARFAEHLGVEHAIACNSGTAAVHAAIAALDPSPGDEIITTAVTDMGAIAPILYQGAIPVFADIDPVSFNVTADTIAARLSPRTVAIIVTHLFGNPADLDEIVKLAERHGLPVIEDAAQAYGAHSRGRHVGTLGTIGCFSLQQGKHITCGEGGVVVTNDDALARRIELFVNKGWGYGDEHPDHEFLALNGRMSELQAAVALAQLEKLPGNVRRRIDAADRLTQRLVDVPGLAAPSPADGDVHSYWKYSVRVDPTIVAGGPPALAGPLRELGVPSAPRYIQKPAFDCAVIRDQRTFGDSRFPFSLARAEALDYSRALFPGTYAALDGMLVLPMNERLDARHVDHMALALRSAVMA